MKKNATAALASALVAIASLAPLAAAAESAWVPTNDEAGWALATPAFGVPFRSTAPAYAKPLDVGDTSADGRYVYAGEGSGWHIRPAQYRFEGGRFVRVDDSVGALPRLAEAPAETNEQHVAAGNMGGS